MAKSVRQKEINFLTVLSGRKSKKRLNPRSFIMPCVVLLIAIAGVGVFGLLHNSLMQVEQESNTIREYLNSAEVNRQLNEAESMSLQAESMTNEANQVASPMENLATYPDMTTEHYAKIFEYAGVNIEVSTLSYNRSTGILSFSATSSYVLSIPTFIGQLRASGLFDDISYSGYVGNNTATSLYSSTSRNVSGSTSSESSESAYVDSYTAASYSFSVECSVKPPDPSANQDESENTEGEANNG